jgi:hypothetical protein
MFVADCASSSKGSEKMISIWKSNIFKIKCYKLTITIMGMSILVVFVSGCQIKNTEFNR